MNKQYMYIYVYMGECSCIYGNNKPINWGRKKKTI